MANVVEIIIRAKDLASKEIQQVSKETQGLTLSAKALGIAAGAAGAAIGGVSAFMADAINDTMAYAQQVREMSQVLGISSDETSRLIQLADDYKIELGELRGALQLALKNGFAPSVDTLADMADKYRELKSPTERAAALTEVFGRNWSKLVPILEQGGDAIREQAAAVEDGLVLSQAQIDMLRQTEKEVDALGDKWTAFKTNLVTQVVPALNDVLGAVNAQTASQALANHMMDMGIMSLDEYVEMTKDVNMGLDYWVNVQGILNEKMKAWDLQMQDGMDTTEKLNKLNQQETIPTIEGIAGSLDDAKVAAQGLNVGLGNVSEDLKSKWGPELTESIQNLVINWSKTFAEAESDVAAVAMAFGNWDEAAVKAFIAVRDAWEEYNALAPAQRDADVLLATLRAISNALQFETGAKKMAPNKKQQKNTPEQMGGNVFTGKPYLVGEIGPELFVPTQNGKIIPNYALAGMNTGGNQYNLTIYTNAPIEPIVRDFEMMRAWS